MRFLIFGLFGISFLLPCLGLAADDGVVDDKTQVKQLVVAQALAMTQESKENYLATMHPESPFYAHIDKWAEIVFEQWDLDVTVNAFTNITVRDDTATARVLFKSCRAGDSDYEENVSIQTIIFKRKEGVWLMFGGRVERVNYAECKK